VYYMDTVTTETRGQRPAKSSAVLNDTINHLRLTMKVTFNYFNNFLTKYFQNMVYIHYSDYK